MIMPSQENTLDTNMATNDFSIEMNGTMFSMLSKNVYNDVILAPIREWSTNAIDACLEANKEINFDVHLPTTGEATFSVRDYGTGLDNEQITTLFATFGASTKRSSNKFNGTFGIGRMSALAYSSQFTVESFKDGKHITYLITTKDSIPQMIHMGTMDTVQPNGLKLSLPVEARDFSEFKSKAKKLYKFFSHKPSINIEIDTRQDTVFTGSNWELTSERYGDPILVMGNVPYTISTYETNVTGSFIFHADLGAVSITPGRESLTYDKATVKYINEAHETALKELTQTISNKLTSIPKDDYKEYAKFNSGLTGVSWQIKSEVAEKLAALPNPFTYFRFHNGDIYMQSSLNNQSITVRSKSAHGSRFDTYDIAPSKDHIFMIADTRTGLPAAADGYLDGNSYKKVILLSMSTFKKADLATFKSDAETILANMGITDYAYSSDYVSDSRGKQANSGLFKPHHITTRPGGTVGVVHNTIPAKEYKDTVLYLPTSGSYLEQTDRLSAYMMYLTLYRIKNNTNYRIVGVPKKYTKELKSLHHFKEFYGFIDDLHTKTPISFANLSERSSEVYGYLRTNKKCRTDVKYPIEVKEYLTEMTAFIHKHKDSDHRFMENTILHTHFNIDRVTPSLATTSDELSKKYGIFFKLLDTSIHTVEDDDINEYLKLFLGEDYDTLCEEREHINDDGTRETSSD